VLVPVALVTAAGVASLAWLAGHQGPRQATTEEESLVKLFARKVNNGDSDALQLLGPEAAFNDYPVSEEEAEAKYADYYLRRPRLIILEVRPGEPGRDGKMQTTPNRYTLLTKTSGATPPLRVRDDKGEVDRPSQLSMTNPALVVEVKDGRVRGVRTELNTD
jgi:hypothetical protein